MTTLLRFVFSLSLLPIFSNATLATEPIAVSSNYRYLIHGENKPFFWLGDTAWLLLKKLNREATISYLDDRRQKGFNVIQVMVLHNVGDPTNSYNDAAIDSHDLLTPIETKGDRFNQPDEYDYWDHLEWVLEEADKRAIHLALVPLWGSNIEAFSIDATIANNYGSFLGKRFRNFPNIVWLNGGDVDGSKYPEVWDALAQGIRIHDPVHLMTFHPRGRLMSSMWFHDKPWLDFNMVQSGHRRYDQDDTDLNFGEDNWRYIQIDWKKAPIKPTLDAEPSYEGIPQGLHDTTQPRWSDNDVRRYAYWSVFAGACGFTYGHNAVMQFYEPNRDGDSGAYGATTPWQEALNAPGASQMKHLKTLIESRPMLGRVPCQDMIIQKSNTRYRYLLATRGERYAFIYSYTGDVFEIKMGLLPGQSLRASWYSPRDGTSIAAGMIHNSGAAQFDPPGSPHEGNDWVLILDSQ